MVDNAIIHSFPDAPYIARAAVYLRDGSRIREFIPVWDRILLWLTRPEEIRPEEIARRIFLYSELI